MYHCTWSIISQFLETNPICRSDLIQIDIYYVFTLRSWHTQTPAHALIRARLNTGTHVWCVHVSLCVLCSRLAKVVWTINFPFSDSILAAHLTRVLHAHRCTIRCGGALGAEQVRGEGLQCDAALRDQRSAGEIVQGEWCVCVCTNVCGNNVGFLCVYVRAW